MYRGRWQLGQEIPLAVLCVDADETPTNPDAAPFLDVYSTSAKVIAGRRLPLLDRNGQRAFFQLNLRLDSRFAAGVYQVVYHYTIGSYLGQVHDTFEVVAGGDADGASIAAYWYERPHADFLVRQLDSGQLVKGKNPRL